MCSTTLDEIMNKSQRYEHSTKAKRYSNVFKNIYMSKPEEISMADKIAKYVKKEVEKAQLKSDIEEYEYIVEDPQTVPVSISFEKTSNLPFFLSLQEKLGINKIKSI